MFFVKTPCTLQLVISIDYRCLYFCEFRRFRVDVSTVNLLPFFERRTVEKILIVFRKPKKEAKFFYNAGKDFLFLIYGYFKD